MAKLSSKTGKGKNANSLANLKNSNKDFKNATFINTGSKKLSNLDNIKFAKIAGIPDDFKGEVTITASDKTPIISVRAFNDKITMTRTMNESTKVIDNKYFKIKSKEDENGKPIPNSASYSGNEVFKIQVEAAIKNGYKRMITHAAGSKGDKEYNGYYTWARLGYEPKKTDKYVNKIIEKYNKTYKQNATSLGEVMSTQTGREYWRENGIDFEGTFDLKPNSYSVKTLRNYKKSK